MSGLRQASVPTAHRGIGRALRANSGAARAAWRVLRVALAIGASVLIAFHVALLWDRVADGRLLDPSVGLRWAAALLLAGMLAILHRQGVPLATGRRALVVWLLVAVLHWSAGAAEPGTADSWDATSVIFVVPTIAAAVCVGISPLLAARRAAWAPAFSCLYSLDPVSVGHTSAGWRLSGTSRAPPLQII